MAEKRKPRRRRKKKSGKYTPLIWLITGVLIALSLVYSNTLFKNQQGEGPLLSTTNFNPLANLEGVASNIFQSHSTRKTNNHNDSSVTDTEEDKQSLSELFENYIPDYDEKTEEDVIIESDEEDKSDEPVLTKVDLYLAEHNNDTVKISDISVYLEYEDSLLKETLETLIDYRDDDDLLNLIPFNTGINDVWINNRVAYIDFNEEFSYNSYGVIGYQIQIYQVVYTATQFDTVDAVYFYLEGEPLEYMGGDGYPLNNPIYPYSYLPQFDL